jgi:hypothetical protein
LNFAVPTGLRYRRLWLLLGLVMAAAVAAMALVPTRDLPDVDLSDKFQHALAFLALAFWFGSILMRRNYLWLALALLAFGAAIELVQGSMNWGRRGDWHDLRADAVGVVAGLLLALTPLGRWARFIETRIGKARV